MFRSGMEIPVGLCAAKCLALRGFWKHRGRDEDIIAYKEEPDVFFGVQRMGMDASQD